MNNHLDALHNRLATERADLVSIRHTQGSVPRETGTWMAVFASGEIGTIGGGQLEWAAIRRARERLTQGQAGPEVQSVSLGPSLGQCCGGRLQLHFEGVGPEDRSRLALELVQPDAPVALFGGGHVGRAIVHALSPLPYAVHWIDSRDQVFPADTPARFRTEHSDPVQAAVSDLAADSRVLIMSFSHAEDLDIVAACLMRQRERGDLRFIGLIGSRTKWVSFSRRLRERGFSDAELARVTCPIGLPGIGGKAPEVIAVSVVAQLLLNDSLAASEKT